MAEPRQRRCTRPGSPIGISFWSAKAGPGDPEAAINRAAMLADSAVAMDPNDARA